MVRHASPPGETGVLVVDSVVSFPSLSLNMWLTVGLVLFMFTYIISDDNCVLQVPGGPAHKHLEPGDVLVRMNGEVSYNLKYTELH